MAVVKEYLVNDTRVLPTDYLLVPDLWIDCIILTLIVIFNISLLVLEVKIWIQRKKLSQPRFLIISLAVIDTVSGVFGLLPRFFIFDHLLCRSYLALAIYMATRFVLACFIVLSKLTVLLMGIERFISIRAPFFYIRNCSLNTFVFIKTVLVLYAMILGSVSVYLDLQLFEIVCKSVESMESLKCQRMILFFEYYVYSRRGYLLRTHLPIVNGFSVYILMQDFVLIVVLLLCNTSVIRGLRDMERRIHVTCPRPSEARTDAIDLMTASGREFSRLMVAINIVVLFLTTPYMARSLCNHLGVLSSSSADFVTYHLTLCSGFVNPFLYGLLRRKLCRHIRAFLSRRCKLCRSNDVSPLELTQATNSGNVRTPNF